MIIKNIIITKDAIMKIVGSCSRFANFEIKKEEWYEVFGLLIGKREGNEINIVDVVPLEHNFNKGDSMIVFNELAYINTISEQLDGVKIIGWYNSRYSGKNQEQIEITGDDFWFHSKFKIFFSDSIFLLFNQLRIAYRMKQIMQADEIYGFNMFDIIDNEISEINWKCKDDAHLVRVNIDELMMNISESLPRYDLKKKYMNVIKRNYSNLYSQYENFIEYYNTNKIRDLREIKFINNSQIMDLKNLCNSIKKDIDMRLLLLEYTELKEKDIKCNLRDNLINFYIEVDELQNNIENILKKSH
ncbi:MAG: hypothetical protein ACTSPY_06985 [Candidatus Helarchaeota archaeon]